MNRGSGFSPEGKPAAALWWKFEKNQSIVLPHELVAQTFVLVSSRIAKGVDGRSIASGQGGVCPGKVGRKLREVHWECSFKEEGLKEMLETGNGKLQTES